MASTPIGTVFLYEMGAGDLAEYERQPYEDALDRVRWLLTRVASRSSAGEALERPPMLTRGEVGGLGDQEVESLAEVFVASPANEWHARKAQESAVIAPRGADEPATSYLDRLLRWRSTLPPEHPVRRQENAFMPSAVVARPEAATRQLLTWVSAGLALTVLLSTAALAFAAMSYFESKADHEANELWRADMRRMQEAKPAAAEKVASELAAENARLRYRLEVAEAKSRTVTAKAAPAPAKAAAPVKSASRSGGKSSQGRSGRQAAR
jgi:hypothetical protein